MAKRIEVSQGTTYIEISGKRVDVVHVGAHVEVSSTKVEIIHAGAYIEVFEEFPTDIYGPKIQVI